MAFCTESLDYKQWYSWAVCGTRAKKSNAVKEPNDDEDDDDEDDNIDDAAQQDLSGTTARYYWYGLWCFGYLA